MSYDCVCDYDSPEVYRSKTVKARKEYGCYECAGRIFPGDLYEYHFGVMYGDSYSGRTCIKCVEIREWVQGNIPCFCWAHGNIMEDARGAIDEACYRAPEETVGIRFGFARRLHQRDEYHRRRTTAFASEKSPPPIRASDNSGQRDPSVMTDSGGGETLPSQSGNTP